MSRRFDIATFVLTALCVSGALIAGAGKGAVWVAFMGAAAAWSAMTTKKLVARLTARPGEFVGQQGAGVFIFTLLKLPVLGAIAYAANRSGPVALLGSSIALALVYFAFVWDTFVSKTPSPNAHE